MWSNTSIHPHLDPPLLLADILNTDHLLKFFEMFLKNLSILLVPNEQWIKIKYLRPFSRVLLL